MPSIAAYHRPDSLDEALSLLAAPNRRALGGGTVVVPESRVARAEAVELVDLQALALDGWDPGGASLTIGAMVRLGDLADRDDAPPLLRDLARRELPSALRNQATIGGTVALGDPDSVLLAGLLVHGSQVALHAESPISLATALADGVGRRIVTGVTVDPTGTGAIAATGRTPADTPIVAAVARADAAGVHLALTGVATHPVLVDPDDPTAGLEPPSDFRGSADYRLHLAATLGSRAVQEVSS